ncbi:MAG: PQQ-dependent dehydrogenase, methanol/ethanol family [Bryobacterales bacterium]
MSRTALLSCLASVWLCLAAPLPAQVTYERILEAGNEPENWLTYSGNYLGHRHSPLRQITPENASRLRPKWVYQISTTHGFEATPLVDGNVMYISEPPSDVTALDTRTGRPLWKYTRPIPENMPLCCGRVNRGVAVLDDMVYVGTLDSHLVALDAKSGQVRWDIEVADYKAGISMTAAPLAINGKIILGMAGGEFGVRGFLDAYDAKTGERAWRFWTVPVAGEPGAETWAGDSWKQGSATTWVTGSYDPELNLIYWGTGNPGPDWNGDVRKGDNLYSDCLVVLDADTGELKWYFQFTPHDVHDWDSVQVPVLIDGEVRGEQRKLVLFANRNGFSYVLDRESGKFVNGKAYVKQTWASGLDDNGRPMVLPNTSPTVDGNIVYPNLGGGTNWQSPAYNPELHLFFVASREMGHIYYKGEAEFKVGSLYNAGGAQKIPGEEAYGAIRAFHPESVELKWEFPLHSPPGGGVLSTAGGLVFGGTGEGDVFALDATNGKPVWRFQAGGSMRANPISYASEGKQYVAFTAGRGLFVFGLDE